MDVIAGFVAIPDETAFWLRNATVPAPLLTAVHPPNARLLRKAQVRLVDDGRGREGVPAALGRELPVRDALELVVDQRHEAIHRRWSIAAQSSQRLRDFLLLLVRHSRGEASHELPGRTGMAPFARFVRVSSHGISRRPAPRR